jgi:hypothetical protein
MLDRRLAGDLVAALRNSTMTWQDYLDAQRRMEDRAFEKLLAFVKGETYRVTLEERADEEAIRAFEAGHAFKAWHRTMGVGPIETSREDPRGELFHELERLAARWRARLEAPPDPEEVRRALIQQIEFVLGRGPMPTHKESVLSLLALWLSLGEGAGARLPGGESAGRRRSSVPAPGDGRQGDG